MNVEQLFRLSIWASLLVSGSVGASAVLVLGQEKQAPADVSFERDIQPILAAKCYRCHGEDVHKGELSLVTPALIRKGGESGEILVPGKAADSRMYELVSTGEMPSDKKNPLTAAEVELLRRWIDAGAHFSSGGESAREVTQHDVIPILLLRCTPCHGRNKQEGGLDLRSKASLLKGGKSGPAAVAGKPDESLIVKRVRAEEMPPRRQLVAASVKPMEAAELKTIEAWIAAGLPQSPLGPDIATSEADKLVTDEDRKFWSFRPPVRAPLPVIRVQGSVDRVQGSGFRVQEGEVGNAVDAFILDKLAEKQLSLSPPATRRELIRRVTFDLVGLPPTPEEVAEFIADDSPDAYERLVDRMLASPRYGERWARHWLDVAGYADSEGAQNEDRVRPNMWRYRDYIVRAFNADKPYDRFLHEQIAGDELADYENAPAITGELYDNLVATGFLRTAPDRTFANITNFVPDRLEVVADEIQILSSSVLALTMHCARCHSHKFDPLPQRDYYRLAAALKDALDEHDWLGPEKRHLPYVLAAEREPWQDHERQIDARVAPPKDQLEKTTDDSEKKKLQEEIAKIEKERRPEPTIRALWSRGEPSPTYLLKRGNYLTPGAEVGPGVPSVLTDGKSPFEFQPPWSGSKTTGRRLALARWLTTPDHPLTARVLVNRVWKHHFGTGIVTTLGNFGRTGAAPSHPELLDWLALDFVRSGWSIKHLHRLMVSSATYRQSSQVTAELAAADGDNRWLSRMALRRMEAEVLRDSLLLVAGQLDETQFGPPVEMDVREDGLVTAKSTSRGSRRSIFVLHRRTKLPTILENFDSPQMGPNCLERGVSIVAPQALHLLNNAAVKELADRFAERIEREVGADRDAQIVRIHEIAYAAAPTEEELHLARQSLDRLTQAWRETLGAVENAEKEAAQRALRNYCHAVLNSAAFMYID
jgi:cytochrome c553